MTAQLRAECRVDLEAIRSNVAVLAGRAPTAQLMAVVKADGYGHGAVTAARAALAGGATWLAVALVEEGRVLRAAGIAAPILLLSEPPTTAIPGLLAARITPTVYTPTFVAALDAAVRDAAVRDTHLDTIAVHCEIDTGMRRVGAPAADWHTLLTALEQCDRVTVGGVWSHLACADEPGHPSITRQIGAFDQALDTVARHRMRPDLVHLCNSAATLTLPDQHRDMVRCGIALYGLDPGGGLLDGVDLRPALRWVSRVALAKRLAAGEAVSYGHAWSPEHDTTVVTVPVGYADGVSRRLGGVGQVVVCGRRRPIVGRVTMDQILVDVGDDDVAAGDEVVLIGASDGAAVRAEDWATWLDTITYEVVSAIGPRVPRVVVGASSR